MRIFCISDLHVDFNENYKWLRNLSKNEYNNDILLLGGDISHSIKEVDSTFNFLKKYFKDIFFVPGNHDLWVKDRDFDDSMAKFDYIIEMARGYDIKVDYTKYENFSIVPLFGWYDYTFGKPTEELKSIWMDYNYCRWPDNFNDKEITAYFLELNKKLPDIEENNIITFSHFLPKIELMPSIIPKEYRVIYPVLGTSFIDDQIRKIGSKIHVYGHSHVNIYEKSDGILYINNAYGYPNEKRISRKQ